MDRTTVIVPGTTANLGCGFDCIGAALTIYNQFEFNVIDDRDLRIEVEGEEANKVSRDKNNLIYQSFLKLYKHIDRTPPKIEIIIKLGVPLSRGLGSSATAIIGGLVGANQIADRPLSNEEILNMAIEIEGHPDNVVPAFMGKARLSVGEPHNWQIAEIPWHSEIVPIVAIPDFELSTKEARAVLPSHITRQDAVFNIGRMGLLIKALELNNPDWLSLALDDRLHQPYRQKLIRGYNSVRQSAITAGAYGMVISGAGPTLLSLCDRQILSQVTKAIERGWSKEAVKAVVKPLELDTQGVKICG